MHTHVKIVAVLHILGGALSLMAALVLFLGLGVAGGVVLSQGEGGAAAILGIIGFIAACFFAILALPGIVGGVGLLAQQSWARVLVVILGILHLPNFPLGTALGIYTLWVLLGSDLYKRTSDSVGPIR